MLADSFIGSPMHQMTALASVNIVLQMISIIILITMGLSCKDVFYYEKTIG